MNIQKFTFNPVSENTYVIYDETKECAIIDAGCHNAHEEEALASFVIDNKLKVKHIINTHLHFDHVLGVNFVSQKFDLPLEAHEEDQVLLDNLPKQLEMFGFGKMEGMIPTIGKKLTEGDTIKFGNQEFNIFHIPGHSPGSIVFYNKSAGCVFVGDVLFRGSIGRTDLVGGDYHKLIKGIQDKLFTLPDDTVVYSGHGPSTTIGWEKSNNQFFI